MGAAVAALVVGGVIIIGSTPGTAPSNAAAATLRRAVITSLKSRSLAESITETISTPSGGLTVSGTAACNLQPLACESVLQFSSPSSSLSSISPVTERMVNQMVFIKFGPHYPVPLPKPWLSVPMPFARLQRLPGESLAENPVANLVVLARAGASVTKLGPATVDGTRATAYRVQFSGNQYFGHVDKYTAELPSWVKTALKGVTPGAVTETVYIAPDGKLRKVSANLQITVSGATATVSVSAVITS
jgi:hypothetical protein